MRPRVYQLFLRLFSNTRPPGRPNGTVSENGCGSFADLDDRALQALRDLGITHLWLLGILRHATGTSWPEAGLPADDPDLLKGIAGSPFAVRDLFDVCPDYARDPRHRLDEFRELVERIHRNGLRVLIDFVPNHVARSHASVVRPDLDPGRQDDRSRFFAVDNHFYHLPGQGPLVLPTLRDGVPLSDTCRAIGGCDGRFEPESVQARVTGNNVASPRPSEHDWYETVKLNYGHDFTLGHDAPRPYPHAGSPGLSMPATWRLMDAVLAHWQDLGVDGFRCDMAHLIPPEFWGWAIPRARGRAPGCLFVAEAYDDDPAKVTTGNVLAELVAQGFDAVYDHRSYQLLKGIFDGPKWANDLDGALQSGVPAPACLRYAENHDEVRIAHPGHWGGAGPGIGLAVTALLFGVGCGPVLLHNGQEVGEPALEPLGYGGGNGRTSIFDYGCMPELQKWVNGLRFDGGGLSAAQRALRAGYARLLQALEHPALSKGDCFPLNPHNVDNPAFGRLPGEPASGHWLHAWLRTHRAHDGRTHHVLGIVNLHPAETLRGVRIRLPRPAIEWLFPVGSSRAEAPIGWADLLDDGSLPGLSPAWEPGACELVVGDLGPARAWYLSVQ